MRNRHHLRSLAAILVTASVLAAPAAGGELEPPAPPGPTMKTLTDVEPRTAIRNNGAAPIVINQRGSYYLAEDIFAMPNNHGIEIIVSHVTLDLNGFSVIGSTEIATLSGIYTAPDSDLTNVVIRNGTVRDFSDHGITLDDVEHAVIEHVAVHNSGVDGTGNGIEMGFRGRISDTIVADSADTGIRSQSLTSMIRVSTMNNNVGIFCAITHSVDCQVIDSVVTGNTQYGVGLTFGMIDNSLVRGNGDPDILAGGTLVRGNRAGVIDGGGSSLLVDNLTSQ